MPRVVHMQCDAPDCEEPGDVCEITVDGRTYEVILGPEHVKQLKEIASWGQVQRSPSKTKRTAPRDTSRSRLERLAVVD